MQVSIADTEINSQINFSKFYPDFRASNSQNKINVKLRIENKYSKIFSNLNLFFDPESFWKIYKCGSKKFIRIDHPDNCSWRIAECDENFSNIEIFTSDKSIFCSPNKNLLEYPLDELTYINNLSYNNGIVLHAAGVKHNEKAFIFLGQSGAGKSTISKIFDSQNLTILNDDRIILRKVGENINVYGTPWHGEAKLYSNESATLTNIFFIKHGTSNTVKKLDPVQAAVLLIARAFSPFWDTEGMQAILGLAAEITERIQAYELTFLPNKSIVDLVLDHASVS